MEQFLIMLAIVLGFIIFGTCASFFLYSSGSLQVGNARRTRRARVVALQPVARKAPAISEYYGYRELMRDHTPSYARIGFLLAVLLLAISILAILMVSMFSAVLS
jgi:hypothetical protein